MTTSPDNLPPDAAAAEDRLATLERENAKLRKINRVLMERVERSMDFQGNAFSLFQTAIVLESKVRERTMALETALRELEDANRALQFTKEEEEQAKHFLSEAIESINEGFVLCDSEDHLVLTNSKYRELWPGMGDGLSSGMTFEEVVRRGILSGLIADANEDPEDWLQRRMESHRAPGEPFVIQMRDGQWLQVSERRTRNGGVVGLYTDITEIKVSEKRRRERELAQKSVLLQATLDNLSQGVSVFDGANRLVAWNQRFIELLKVPRSLAWPGTSLRQFLDIEAMSVQFSLDETGALRTGSQPAPHCVEHETEDGRVLEIRRNRMPDGGFVTTYTDITERKRSEEALRDSERRIRLVTDAMPALIAYVDAECRYRFTNKAYEDWFGRPRSKIDGRPMRDVLGADLYDRRRQFVDAALRGEECTFEMTMPAGDRGVQYALATYVPHIGSDGQVLGFFALIQDITERRLAAEQLREAKENLERRVEERTAELRTAKAEAEQANLSKTRFLAAASHDLLQPLNAARVFISALAERRIAPRNRTLVQSSLTALDSVDELLTTLLDISKLDAGVLPTEIRDFSLNDLISALGDEYAIMARGKGIDLRIMPTSVAVRSDPRLLGRIVRNFLSNALRYTGSGRIVLGCRRRGDHVMIGVWDTGPGIPEDKLEEIFEEFRRLSTKAESGEMGMGLGLAIVRRIARMLDHSLVVHSTEGRGSLFGVEVPLAACAPVPALYQPAPPPARAGMLGGAQLLMIDNDPDILVGMAALLEGWGCETLPAVSQAAALAVLQDSGRRPDVIIADYHLDHDQIGLDAIAAVQALCGGGIPAVVITANHSSDLQNEVREAGYHLLNKPVKPAKLRSLLGHLLRERKKG